ncbi:MAG: 2-oxoglutarate ferredoxin oxidoreductase subunit delta [Candidatus Cloacimonadota bacterium]|nr:MAG: 2-oxoglutarate ferredoxin oxidoreductase subunit delta [Candidatus Cloacimonadota bacterium]
MQKKPQGKILENIRASKKEEREILKITPGEVEYGVDYQKGPVYIYYDWCKKCGICVAFCPTKCLASKKDGTPYVKYPEKCTHCEKCDMLCPDYAITGAINHNSD